MRISDWSSDVCSSDLDGPRPAGAAAVAAEDFCETPISASAFLMRSIDVCERLNSTRMVPAALTSASMTPGTLRRDRKSVGEGKRVPVRVDLDGRRIIKKKNNTQAQQKTRLQNA